MMDASCSSSDPEAWFPALGDRQSYVKKICQGCDVRIECLEYALAHREDYGVWGGVSEYEIRKEHRNRSVRGIFRTPEQIIEEHERRGETSADPDEDEELTEDDLLLDDDGEDYDADILIERALREIAYLEADEALAGAPLRGAL